MFDGSLPEPATMSEVDDAVLVGAIAGWARASAAAEARGLAAVAELVRRRCDDDDDRNSWACDPWDSAAAEVSAALNIGHGRAVGQLDLGVTLRDRLPKVNALFLAGQITARIVSTLAWRTLLVGDDALAGLDDALAERAAGWGPLSEHKLLQAVDVWVDKFDPAAVRRTRDAVRGRSITVGDRDDAADGTTSIWGRLLGTDATLLDRRLTTMAHAVCEQDPRTVAQRRADALGALAAGADHLACTCGSPACPAAGDDGRASSVVVHIVAEAAALDAQADPGMHGEDTPAQAAAPAGPAPVRPQAGIIPCGGIVPAPLLAALIRTGATVRYVSAPKDAAEPQYRPSTALDDFVRIRDLTCRFPGCDRPAEFCDVDHSTPWPEGPTHPSGLKCYCRKHHLLKTFWAADGWTDRQLPDGTVLITTPAGRTYTTKPGSALLFPSWNTTTQPPPPGPAVSAITAGGRNLMMPKRKRTRAQDRDYRIRAERAYNDRYVAERNMPPRF